MTKSESTGFCSQAFGLDCTLATDVSPRAKLLCCLPVALCAAAFAFIRLSAREPSYKGMSLTYWLEQGSDLSLPANGSPDVDVIALRRERTAEAVRHIGTNALPHLLRLLNQPYEEPWLKRKLRGLNERQNFFRISVRPTVDWQNAAREAFQALGPAAAPAIPDLERLLQSRLTCSSAADCLWAIGPQSVPALVRALTNQDDHIVGQCLQRLGDLGPAAHEAIPVLVAIAQSTNLPQAYTALQALSELEPYSARFVPLFAERLADTNLVPAASFALGRLLDDRGVPTLLNALTNQDHRTRTMILAALSPYFRSLGYSNEPATPYTFSARVCAFNNSSLSFAWRTHTGQEADGAVPALAGLFQSTNAEIKLKAIECLADYGIASAPGLAMAAADTNQQVSSNALATLQRFGLETRAGGIVRGPKQSRRIALVFTGHEYAEGAETILDQLDAHHAKASFFFTGDFLANPTFAPLLQRLAKAGHLLGPHSDKHLLYCAWDDPKRTLVTRPAFVADVQNNLEKIAALEQNDSDPSDTAGDVDVFGRLRRGYFLPAFEHYNEEIALWTRALGLTLINPTPGTRSAADYTGEADRNFVSSQAIYDSIVAREGQSPDGLNGFILLLHVGSGPARADKFHTRFGELLDFLGAESYQLVRVDKLLEQ
jgi:peptidoglycan/xylan/chitin deacetylase (PgdA/CDA1 family)